MTRGSVGAIVLLAISVAGCSGADGDPGDYAEVPGIGATRIDVPRATTPGGTACTLSLPADASVEERALALRDLGLFADRADESDAAFADAIASAVGAAWGVDVDAGDPFTELLVAEADTDRVWWHDLEADVVDENQVYVSTLQDWAAISKGAFEPTDITETWASDSGPVTVTFTLGGETHEVHPAYLEDWIDPTIVGAINELIAPSGRRFESVKAFDQTAFVIALTADERDALEARGWCFE